MRLAGEPLKGPVGLSEGRGRCEVVGLLDVLEDVRSGSAMTGCRWVNARNRGV